MYWKMQLVSIILIHWLAIYLAPVVQNVDSVIHRIDRYPVIYPMDSTIQRLNNPGQVDSAIQCLNTWGQGPFLESPGNFSGPKSNIEMEI